MRHLFPLLLPLLMVHALQAQDSVDAELHRGRLLGVAVVGGVAIGGSLVALDQAWFEEYEQVPFQTFNDGDEW